MDNQDTQPVKTSVYPELFDGQGGLSVTFLSDLRRFLSEGDAASVKHMMMEVHAADMGDVLEALGSDERFSLIKLLGYQFDYSALVEIDDRMRARLMDQISNEDIARGISELDSDDAVYILEDLGTPDREDILSKIPALDRLPLKRGLDFPEESAGRRMQSEFIAIAPFWNVGQTIDHMRNDSGLPVEFYQIYVVDPSYNLLGIVPLDRLLRSKRDVKIEKIMNTNVFEIPATQDQEAAAHLFDRYDLLEVAVVDENNRMVGVLTIDDIVDVIHEEAEEDFRALVGIGDENLSDSVFNALKSRVVWLLVNLVTAIFASMVIGLFNATIEQMVALAVLMPIVASMGGNAGTQTMTVTVRAISMRELDQFNVQRLINREALVGLVNGFIFALIMGTVASFWFSNIALGAVIGLAMVVNMFAAGVAGILIPISLNKFGADPAVASSAFVTTVTDVVGFFAFLGLAALWFGVG